MPKLHMDVERCANVACGSPVELLHLEYAYGNANNGNPREQVIRSAGMNVRQRYDFDGLNRLQQFREEPAGGGAAAVIEDYCYDRHGNRAVVARPGLSAQTPQVSVCTEGQVLGLFPMNRIAGTSYDVGGELGSDGWNGLRFDLEGRLRKSIPTSGTETSYEYDGEGRRVLKQTGLSKTVFVYDAAGQLAAEYGGAVSVSGTEYVHGDMLGSTRVVTDGVNVGRRFDYWPFGGELTAGDTAYRTVAFAGAGPAQRFTGKERDGETGLDYFGARYMSAAQGRFSSPDPHNPMMIAQMATAAGLPAEAARSQMNAFLEDPQNWNKYSYVRNNPLRFTDPFGEAPVEGHHLIPARQGLTGLAAEFTNAVKAGADGVGYPNQPGFNGPHRAYNAAADQILQGFEKQFGASRNSWSLSQWRQAANGILNSNNKAIRDFLDLLNKNNAGRTIPALAAAINAYKPSAALIASSVGESLLNLFRLPLFIMVDPALTDSQRHVKEEIKKSHSNCLLDRATGNCVY